MNDVDVDWIAQIAGVVDSATVDLPSFSMTVTSCLDQSAPDHNSGASVMND